MTARGVTKLLVLRRVPGRASGMIATSQCRRGSSVLAKFDVVDCQDTSADKLYHLTHAGSSSQSGARHPPLFRFFHIILGLEHILPAVDQDRGDSLLITITVDGTDVRVSQLALVTIGDKSDTNLLVCSIVLHHLRR